MTMYKVRIVKEAYIWQEPHLHLKRIRRWQGKHVFIYLKIIKPPPGTGEVQLKVLAALMEQQSQNPHSCSKPCVTPIHGKAMDSFDLLVHHMCVQDKHSVKTLICMKLIFLCLCLSLPSHLSLPGLNVKSKKGSHGSNSYHTKQY